MKKFIREYKNFVELKNMTHGMGSSYRFCWFPYINSNMFGDYQGHWSAIELFKYELKKIDSKKCEIIVY